MTNSSANSVNGGIPPTNVTGETVDISKYLDFGFYEKVWFKDNADLYPIEPGKWLVISNRTGRFICCHILTQTGKFIYRSTIHRVTNIDLSTDEVRENFTTFDTEVNQRLKSENL